jgi:hypothetical protein
MAAWKISAYMAAAAPVLFALAWGAGTLAAQW